MASSVSPLRLLMTTQVIDQDHPILGFSHTWATKIAQRIAHLHILTSYVGRHSLPPNVTLWSLGKEEGAGRLQRLLRHQRIGASLILGGRVDGIFVQQTEEHVLGLAPYALVRRLPIVLFKGHGRSLRFRLRIATLLVSKALTSAEVAFPLRTRKKLVIGQGIDTEIFQPGPEGGGRGGTGFRIVSVGRLSPIKAYEVQIDAARLLVSERGRRQFRLHIYGGWEYPGYREYLEGLRTQVAQSGLTDVVHFEGSVLFGEIPRVYQHADLVIHSSRTLSLDKTVLEAMACAIPVVAPNDPYATILGPYADDLTYPADDAAALANQMNALLSRAPAERHALGLALRGIIVRDHSVEHFADKLVALFGSLSRVPSGATSGRETGAGRRHA